MLDHIGKNQPLVVVFAGICCGIFMSRLDWSSLAFGLVLTALLLSRKRIAFLCAGFALGIAAHVYAPAWAEVTDGIHEVGGVVSSTEYALGTFRMILREVSIDGIHIRGRVLINVYEDAGGIRNGLRVSCPVMVKQPRGYGNSGEFDYREYLLTRNIVMKGSVKSGHDIMTTGGTGRQDARRELALFMDRYARPEAELIKAMVLGDRSGITYSIRDRFNALGIGHLMAISGLHIGIAMMIGYGALSGLLRIVPVMATRLDTPMIARLGGICAALAFTLFAGLQVTAVRACIMAISCAGALIFYRRDDLVGGLALAGVLILMIWPMAVYSASFQLSFCAVLGIGGVLDKTAGAPAWFRWLVITPAAGVFTGPAAVYLFGFISGVGLLANLIIVPAFSIFIMPLAIVGVLLHFMHPGLSGPVFALSMDCLRLVLRASSLFGALHPFPTPWIGWVYLCYTGLILAFWGRESRRNVFISVMICVAIVMLPVLKQVANRGRPMTFDFVSVGQGDCTLITQGGHAVLIDAGPSHAGFDAGRHIVAPHLLRRGCVSLNVVVVTHLHPDHSGGIPFILERFDVGQVWINARQDQNAYFQDVMRITEQKSIPLKYVSRGDRFHIGALAIDVLNPQERLDIEYGRLDQNMQSVVLMVKDGMTTGLFMGDADMFGELVLVHIQKDISADVLKVAHHGSERSCLLPFLDAVRPGISVISCGHANPYGSPASGALERLVRYGVDVYRTDEHGEITVTSLQNGIAVKSARIPADIQ